MKNDENDTRFIAIEKKLKMLVMLCTVQTIALAILILCLVVQQFMPSTLTLIMFLAVVCVFLFFFRNQVPGWIGNITRYAFAQMFAAQKSDSMKDIK